METITHEMIDEAESNIRADFRDGKISREQFKKEMLIVARARKQLPDRRRAETVTEAMHAEARKFLSDKPKRFGKQP